MADQDRDLIDRVLRGEVSAYAMLVDRHKDKAMTLAVRMLKNREDAEEAVQDAFVRAFHSLPSFEWRSSFATWFYRIVYNVCATALARRREPAAPPEDDDQVEEVASVDPLPDAMIESMEIGSIVAEEVEKLPPALAGVVTLFFLHEMTYDEIVQATGMPLGTVKVKLFRARQALRKALAARLREQKPEGARKAATTL